MPSEQAADHLGWLGGFFCADAPAASDQTRTLLGWDPRQPTLIADLESGAYTA